MQIKGIDASDCSAENARGEEIARKADEYAKEMAAKLKAEELAARTARSRESNVRNGEGAVQGKSSLFFSN